MLLVSTPITDDPCGPPPRSGGVERSAEGGDCLRDRGARRVRIAQCVEHQEVVRDAVVADGGDLVAGRAKSRGVRLALVAQYVGLADDQEGGREPGQLLVAGAKR